MRLLADTHLLLWAAAQPEKLSSAARKLLNDPGVVPMFSAASIWEVAIKSALGREDFQVDTRILRQALIDNGYEELPVTSTHAVAIDTLPAIHKDPFDRLLVAQSLIENLVLLTTDALLAQYPGSIRKV